MSHMMITCTVMTQPQKQIMSISIITANFSMSTGISIRASVLFTPTGKRAVRRALLISRTSGPAGGWSQYSGLTPCIALLPLTFAAVKYGTAAVILVNIAFTVGTLGTIIIFTWLGYLGLSWIKLEFFEQYGDVIAGAIIGLLGLATKVFAL